MPLQRHLSDTAAVAAHLYRHFLAPSVRRLIAAALPGGDDDALLLCTWLAGVHDIGILDRWLEKRHRWDASRTAQFSIVVGGHHGLPPDDAQRIAVLDRPHLLGWSRPEGRLWRDTQFELLDWATESTGARDRLTAWRDVELPQQVQVLVTGLVIMADWIAGNPDLFPYRTDTDFDPARIESGLDQLDLTGPWNAFELKFTENLLCVRFGLHEDHRLRPVQAAALKAATVASAPSLMIIEAPMGEGKTEAALLAAEAFAADLQRAEHGVTSAHVQGRNDFVFGTAGELLAAFEADHLWMCHLGLTGKVVIFDEVHAYDVCTGGRLDTALERLAAYNVPVIVLSVCLPAARRAALMATYQKGRQGPQSIKGRRRNRKSAVQVVHPELQADIGYPVVTTSSATVARVESSGRTVAVELRKLSEDPDALIATLQRELDGGGCALVIRNTVRRVQETAESLRKAFGHDMVTEAHSGFIAADRVEQDTFLRKSFGSHEQGHGRPAKHIVVADQIAESLDIDFDVLVTDLAPVDLILQRMGRLHRRTRAYRTRPARCHTTGANWEGEVPQPIQASNQAFEPWTLLRSATVLLPYLDGERMLILPGDVTPLIQAAYDTMDTML